VRASGNDEAVSNTVRRERTAGEQGRRACPATFSMLHSVGKERPSEYRGARPEPGREIFDAANQAVAQASDTLKETG